MNKFILVILLALVYLDNYANTGLQSENNYEIISRLEFDRENWKQTIIAVDKAIENGLNYPILYYRRGISNYHLGNYKASIPDLFRYYEANKKDPFIQIYIYYAYLKDGLYIEAQKFIEKKHKYAKYRVEYKSPSIFKDINLELGNRAANRPDSIGPILYFNFSSEHELKHGLTLHGQYTNLKQPSYWGTYDQNQYLIGVNKYLGRKFSTKFNVHYFKMDANINRSLKDTVKNKEGLIINTIDSLHAKSIGRGLNIYAAINRYYKDFIINLFASTYQYGINQRKFYYGQLPNAESNLNFDSKWSDHISENTKHMSAQFGTDIKWYPSILNQRLTIGINTFLIRQNQSNIYRIRPSILYSTKNNISIYADYLKLDMNHFSQNEGTVIHNLFDQANYIINAGINYQFSEAINLYCIYQNEKREETNLGWNYVYNSLILGIKMNL